MVVLLYACLLFPGSPLLVLEGPVPFRFYAAWLFAGWLVLNH